MTTLRMTIEKDQSHMTEKILNLTLEIIFLLTGKDYKVVMKTSGELLTPNSCLHRISPIIVPPPHCLTTEVTSAKKILEVTKMMIELLTGEVPIRCQDVTIYFSMEEWEYLEGHKELYKDVMMASQPALTSPNGSSNGNPPERCPRPLYSRDSTQEDLTIPHHHQDEKPHDIKVEVKEEEEETMVSEHQPSMEEGEMIIKSQQEESSLYINTHGHYEWKTSEGCLIPSPGCNVDDNALAQHSAGLSPITLSSHHRPHHLDKPMNHYNAEKSSDKSHAVTSDIHVRPPSTDTLTVPSNAKESSLNHEGVHIAKSSLSCTLCGKSFNEYKNLLRHQRTHTAERSFLCSYCGKSFIERGHLTIHQRIHTDDRRYSCSECGKRFIQRGDLRKHHRSHTGERPYSCTECEKCFIQKEDLLKHQRIHTGERPYSCSECGRSFNLKGNLRKHQQIHNSDRPFSCSVCGKGFIRNTSLVRHQNIHTGERPFSCSECGKCFIQKGELMAHQRIHTGERPFLCLECGKCFGYRKALKRHQEIHTG